MKYYWNENEDWFYKTTSNWNKEMRFIPDLRYFINHHPEIKFTDVKMKTDTDGSAIYTTAFNEDKTVEYRQIEKIETEKDFLEWVNLWFPDEGVFADRRKRYSSIKTNIPKCCSTFADYWFAWKDKTGRKRPLFGTTYKELCADNEELFKAFENSYFNGYFFNECESEKIYENVYGFDVNSNHSAIMYYKDFPTAFYKVNAKKFYKKSFYAKRNYYGYFAIKVKQEDPFLSRIGIYNGAQKYLRGWYNNIDISFIQELVGISDIICKELYVVEVGQLDSNKRFAIELAYQLKEKAPKGSKERSLFKNILEKWYGNHCRRRWYKTSWEWNFEKQKPKKIRNQYDWEKVNKTLKSHNTFEYSTGVWICSYARLLLLRLKKAAGNNALYGDIDSIYTLGNCKEKLDRVINSFFFTNHFMNLGELKDEGQFDKFKVLCQKWYIGVGKKDFKVAAAGANHDIVEEYLKSLDNPVESFSKVFPVGVNPYKRQRLDSNGFIETYWTGSICEDRTIGEKLCVVSCAGSGKTTKLIKRAQDLYEQTKDPILIVAFTQKNRDELVQRFKKNGDRIEICTIDQYAGRVIQRSGNDFKKKLDVATDLLLEHPEIIKPLHLLVDEFQDLDNDKFRFISAIPCLTRYYIGDPNQSIYAYDGAMNFFNCLKGFVFERNNTNYRCPQNINDFGEGFLPEKARPHAKSALDYEGEINFLEDVPDDDSVILCRTNREIAFIEEKFPFREIMTVHKSKGLTFESVSVVGLYKPNSDEEANLAYVAATRAKKKLNFIKRDYSYED